MKSIYWLHAISPLHVGIGRGVGFIDLPIMREKVTNWPIVPGSAIKGVLRDHLSTPGENDSLIGKMFGQGGDDNSNAGLLVQTDARIVCLPVRSLYGTFAWVTCPMILQRLKRDAESVGLANMLTENSAALREINLHHPKGSSLVENNKVYLEDLDLAANECTTAAAWAEFIGARVFDESWKEVFKQRFAVVSDNVFAYLSEFATQVNARVRIDDKAKTVAKGALWYEESLPAEAIFAGLAWVDQRANGQTQAIKDALNEKTFNLQVGGNATVGMGRVRCIFGNLANGGAR